MKMLRIQQLLVGAALSMIGMTGLLTQNAHLVQLQPAFVGMVFNTALCLAAIGIAFLFFSSETRRGRFVGEGVAWAAIALASIALIEYALHIDLLVDWRSLHAWMNDTHPAPGRIAVGTCFGFILFGAARILMERATSRAMAVIMHLSILGVLLIGVTGLVGQSLRIDLIYPTLRWPRMSVQEAVAMMLIAAGLWTRWCRTAPRARYQFREDEKIGFIGAVILTVIGLMIGVAGLSVQVATLQKNLVDKLWPMLENRLTLVRTTISHGVERAESAAQRTSVTRFTLRLMSKPDDAEAASDLRGSAQRILSSGFSAVSFLDTNNRELVRAGHFVTRPGVQADLGIGTPATLLWGDSYYLRTRLKLYSDGVWIGTFIAEQPLHVLTDSFFNVQHIGATGELGICVDEGLPQLSCFPQSRNKSPYGAPRRGADGKLTAMSLAVAGQEGLLEGLDYRGHNIVAAYRAVVPGLGLAVKQDTAELFMPVRQEVTWALPLLVLFVGMGAFALRSLVTPIATRLLRSEKDAKEREQHARAVIDNIAEGIITLDESGLIESFSGGAPAIFGYRPEEVIGTNIQNLRPASMRIRRIANIRRYLRAAAGRPTSQLPAQRKDGTVFLMEFAISELRLDERCLFVVIVRDITERKQAEAALFEEKERLHVTLCSIGDAVITTDTTGRVTYLNPVAEHMTGWGNDEAADRVLNEIFNIVDEKTGEPTRNPVESLTQRDLLLGQPENTVLIRRDGARFAIEDTAAPIRDRDDKVLGVVLVFRDVSQARKMAVQLTYQATHDGLTGLINRSEFERRLQHLLDTGRAGKRQHTLLYLDLDRFKIVNDTCGHVAGDELLRQLTTLLQSPLRQSDTLARLGGDEFCVLLDSCAAGPAVDVAEALRRIVSDFRFIWQDKTFPIGISIGLVTFREADATVPEIFRMADAACYVAKDKGRNRIQAYSRDDNMLAQRHGEVGWLDRIRKALEEDRFVLYGQRIMSLEQDGPNGASGGDHVELLLRMVEDGKVIPPMAFIPAAERYGLMPALDRWVIRTAFAHYVERAAGTDAPGTYAINLSGASISDDHFLEFILTQLDLYAVPPQIICFEITETSAIANLNHAAALIQKLKAIGCRFSLDDFGSGMSSFAYLKHLPVDYLKIDGSFVKDMIEDPIDYAMVESINHIGHVMGIQTIAEFVENDAILAALRKTGVDFAQGYGIAKPVPFAAVVVDLA